MKKFLLASAASVLFSTAAFAADLPTRMPAPVYKTPFIPQYFSWTGCYIGVNVGGAWARGELSDAATGAVLSNPNGSGWAGGGQFGCDYQYNNVVFGIETMWDWSDAKGTRSDAFNAGFSDTAKLRGFGTLTGRMGYAVDHSLLYVKAGGAWADASRQITGPGISETQSGNGSGWVVGGGWEYAFAPNWSTKIEYDYMGFGNRNAAYSIVTPPVVRVSGQSVQTVLVGLNYRFGDWGKGPVSARY